MPVAEADRPAERVVTREVEEELLRHPGKWVALTPDALVAVADSPAEAYSQAVDQGVAEPIIYRVPEASTAYFF